MKNHLIILAGGTGTRVGGAIPKQYIEIYGAPVITYTMRAIDLSRFSSIVIVCAVEWQEYIAKNIQTICSCPLFAQAGISRQDSVLHGLLALKGRADDMDTVCIHDAARANCSDMLFSKTIQALCHADGAMPVLPMKDTVYTSGDGKVVSGILNRDELFIGQTPEAFAYGKYLAANECLSPEERSFARGSSEVAYKAGMHVQLVEGDETNFKITTKNDLERFSEIVGGIA